MIWIKKKLLPDEKSHGLKGHNMNHDGTKNISIFRRFWPVIEKQLWMKNATSAVAFVLRHAPQQGSTVFLFRPCLSHDELDVST